MQNNSNSCVFLILLSLILTFSMFSFLWQIWGGLHKFVPFISLACLILLLYELLNSKRVNNISLRSIVSITFMYVTILVIISLLLYPRDLLDGIKDKFSFIPYLLVIISTLSVSKFQIKQLKNISIAFVILYILILISFKDIILIQYNGEEAGLKFSYDEIVKDFCYSAGFILLLFPYLKNRQSFLLGVIYIITLVLAFLLARRNIIITTFLFLIGGLFSYALYLKENNKKGRLVLSLLTVVIMIAVFIPEVTSLLRGNSDIEILSNLSRRALMDSRSFVVEDFINHMDAQPSRWIFGCGFKNKYYSSDFGFRSVIESGYLNIIYRIGIVGLVLYLIIFLKALLVKNTNILICVSKIYIVIFLIETLYAGVPTFNLRWFVVWLAVSFCFNKEIKSLTNTQIKDILCS